MLLTPLLIARKQAAIVLQHGTAQSINLKFNLTKTYLGFIVLCSDEQPHLFVGFFVHGCLYCLCPLHILLGVCIYQSIAQVGLLQQALYIIQLTLACHAVCNVHLKLLQGCPAGLADALVQGSANSIATGGIAFPHWMSIQNACTVRSKINS